MSPLRRLQHWLAHKLGCNEGDVILVREKTLPAGRSVYRRQVAFRCAGCGKLSGHCDPLRLTAHLFPTLTEKADHVALD